MEVETNTFCCGCLSSERKMKSVRDYWANQGFLQILTENSVPISNEYSLCWECEARISNFVTYRDQMRHCYKIIQKYVKEKHETESIKNLTKSNLKICIQRSVKIKPLDISDASEKENFATPIYDIDERQIKEERDVNTHNITKENVNDQVKDENEVYSDDDRYLIEIRNDDRSKDLSSKNKKYSKKEEGKSRPKKKKKRQDYKKIMLSPEEVIKERALMEQRDEYVNAMFKCDKCIVTFTNEEDMTDHALTKHLMHASKHVCNVCQRTFRTEHVLTVHSSRHTVRYRCVVCAQYSSTERAAWRHYRDRHTESENYDIAAKAYQSYEDKKLQDVVKPEGSKSVAQIPCEFCDKTFRWKTSLRKHMERHRIEAGHKRRPYCEPCRLSFTSTANLSKHVRTSSKHQIQLKLRKLKADLPEDAAGPTPTAKDIESIKSKINSQREQYPCPQCEKKFQWKGNLLRHLQSHAARANGDLVCEPCNRTFSSIATYKQHMKISRKHVTENEFKYMCSECGKRFANKIKLRDHIDWEHLKNYTHSCSVCQKVFKSHTSLYLHRQVVHKLCNTEHLCDHCGKSFPNKTKLSSHIIGLHSRASPYKCDTCAARFSWHSCLSRHVRRVHRHNGTKQT